MALLTAVISHVDAARVETQLGYLRALAPQARFVLCHGGSHEEFERLDVAEKLFLDDPSLRGPNRDQSYNQVLTAVHDGYVRHDPSVELAYFIEYDQLILAPDFEERLLALARRTEAGLLAKHAGRRDDTNWPHSVRYRDDQRIARFLAGISRRDDLTARWGCIGTGLLFRREALEAFCRAADGAPHAYLELFIPTVVHHLGFDVADVDTLGDLYLGLRWRPDFDVAEAIAAKRAGRAFVHPFKDVDSLERIRQAPSAVAAGENSSTAGSSAG